MIEHLSEHGGAVTLGVAMGAVYYVMVRVMNMLSMMYLRNAAVVGVVGGFFFRLAALAGILYVFGTLTHLRSASIVIGFVASYAAIHAWETLMRWRNASQANAGGLS